jgi:hypothetical protein
MATPARSLRVVGVHPVLPTSQQFREAVHVRSGSDLASEELSRAEDRVRAHFGGLYLLEIEVCPADSDIDWGAVTQPIRDEPSETWQVPYDEQRIGEDGNRWAFFFHYLDLNRPLRTEIGDPGLA